MMEFCHSEIILYIEHLKFYLLVINEWMAILKNYLEAVYSVHPYDTNLSRNMLELSFYIYYQPVSKI